MTGTNTLCLAQTVVVGEKTLQLAGKVVGGQHMVISGGCVIS